jgi:hypothetical protein
LKTRARSIQRMAVSKLTAGRAGHNGGAGRGAGRGNRKKKQFFGRRKELGVFETADERARTGQGQNQFVETLETLTSYAAIYLPPSEGKANIRNLLRNMTPFIPQKPKKPTKSEEGTYDPIDLLLYAMDSKTYRKEIMAFQEGETHMWSVIWGQSSFRMQFEVEATNEYKDIMEKSDILALLMVIKNIVS